MTTTTATTLPSNIFNESRKRGLLLICIFIFPLMLTSILFLLVSVIGDIDFKVHGPETKYAKIVTPKNRSIVSNKFTIKGTLETPLTDHSYYLMEFRDKLYWPKFDLGNESIEWTKDLTHRAKKNQFSAYRIVMADPILKKRIDDWFITSRKTGKYPGLADLDSNEIVANIRVKSL